MQTIDAIYDNGKLILLGEELKIRAKVRLTVHEILPQKKTKKKFPSYDLGEMKDFNRKELYDEYLSD